MSSIFDFDITGRVKKSGGSLLGPAHEHIVTGILIRLGFDVTPIGRLGVPYDLLIKAYENGPQSKEVILRAAVRTCDKSISFTAGSRGGIDRTYKSGVKEYRYSEQHNDIIIGVDKYTLDLYLVPTRFVENFGTGSKSLRQLALLKNNWHIRLNWRGDYIESILQRLVSGTS